MGKGWVAAIVLLVLAGAVFLGIWAARSDAQTPGTTLLFTVPQGTLQNSVYTMRYSTTPVGADTSAWWNGATLVTGLPTPGLVGSTDSVRVNLPSWGRSYYFIQQTCNLPAACSRWSNVATVSIGPAPVFPPWAVTDLRAR